LLEKHHDSINSSSIIKSRSERDLSNNKDGRNTKSKVQEEEEKNYQFIFQIDENSIHKNKKLQNKRKIEFLEEKLKKPYNQIVEWKLLDNIEVQDQNNAELYLIYLKF